jgi:hypothetical protein
MSTRLRRRRDAGDLCQLRVELWAGVRVAAAMVDDPDVSPEVKLRAVSALATAASVYKGILEIDINARLLALEEQVKARAGRNGHEVRETPA